MQADQWFLARRWKHADAIERLLGALHEAGAFRRWRRNAQPSDFPDHCRVNLHCSSAGFIQNYPQACVTGAGPPELPARGTVSTLAGPPASPSGLLPLLPPPRPPPRVLCRWRCCLPCLGPAGCCSMGCCCCCAAAGASPGGGGGSVAAAPAPLAAPPAASPAAALKARRCMRSFAAVCRGSTILQVLSISAGNRRVQQLRQKASNPTDSVVQPSLQPNACHHAPCT